jgi:hypothetical protein
MHQPNDLRLMILEDNDMLSSADFTVMAVVLLGNSCLKVSAALSMMHATYSATEKIFLIS